MQAIRAYMTQGERMYDNLVNLGDTAGLLEQKSATMANTLKSNFQNLQTAFLSFADKNLTELLQKLTGLLNELAKDPEKVEAGIRGITLAVGGLAAIKIGAGIVSFIANLNSLKSGGGLNVAGLANAGGGAGIPVHVTNWGGAAGAVSASPGLLDQYGNPLTSTGKPPAPKPTKSGTAEKMLNYAVPAAVATGLLVAGNKMNEIYSDKSPEGLARKMVLEDTMSRMMYEGYDPSSYIASHPKALTLEKALELVQAKTSNFSELHEAITVNDLIITPQGQFSTHPDDYILAMKNPAALVNAGLPAVNNRYQTFQGAPGIIQNITNTTNAQTVNDLIVTPRGQFSTHPEDYIFAMKNPEALVTAGIMAAGSRNQTVRGTPGVIQNNSNGISTRTVNDLIITPQGQFSTRPDDYILAMKNPAALVNAALPGEIRNEVRTVERVPQAVPPVIVDGEIRLYSELVIDDKGYRLRQAVGKNTTPYKFAVGSAKDARLIQ
jgi:hypothetical protein